MNAHSLNYHRETVLLHPDSLAVEWLALSSSSYRRDLNQTRKENLPRSERTAPTSTAMCNLIGLRLIRYHDTLHRKRSTCSDMCRWNVYSPSTTFQWNQIQLRWNWKTDHHLSEPPNCWLVHLHSFFLLHVLPHRFLVLIQIQSSAF